MAQHGFNWPYMKTCIFPAMIKRTILLLLTAVLFCFSAVLAQETRDAFIKEYEAASTIEKKNELLSKFISQELRSADNPDEQFTTMLEHRSFFTKNADQLAVDKFDYNISLIMIRNGEFEPALELALTVLRNAEERNDTLSMVQAMYTISTAFGLSGNLETSLKYKYQLAAVSKSAGMVKWLISAYNNLGSSYAQMTLADSALHYSLKALNLATRLNETGSVPAILSTVGEAYMVANEHNLARPYLRKSLALATTSQNQTWIYNDFAESYYATAQYDSSIYYAMQALRVFNATKGNGFPGQGVRACEYLYQSFEKLNIPDSTNKYFRLTVEAKDSLYSAEQSSRMQSLDFQEQLRLQAAEEQRKQKALQRKHNIEYAGIAIGIILFAILFLGLSRSIVVSEKVVSFLGVLGLLLVFEFINLLIHPFLGNITHHSPLLMLSAMVLLAAFLIPLHHRLEHWVIERMVQKNKRIRLEKARQTIEELEGQD